MFLHLPCGFDEGGPKIQFPRVQLALDYKQREFVAHSLLQQVLTAHWLEEFRSWPRLSLASKMLHCFVRFLMLPFLSLASFSDAMCWRIDSTSGKSCNVSSVDDAALVHEALFSVVLAKLAYFCQQSSRLGPFQVSMSRIVLQIAYFLAFCLLVITTFSIALTRMYAYYDGMKRKDKDGNTTTQLSTFSTFCN
ncbi:hypothetical protein JTE90_006724 [Oedothorax gibbosus]|uniref:Uncharacterized protein n=1 Tax=Oedothorax gibbosus TaxID=931172 RepID=A0AAV6TKS9_9ARAC|nr:hypothetical protein JTE90_006724 [Oedothorax gibbosus]